MSSISFILYTLFIFRACNCFQSDNEPLKSSIIGHWKEDQQTRTNLNEFLYNVGVEGIRRSLATTLSWENEQIFKSDGTGIELKMTNGPLKTRIKMKINLDDKFKSNQIYIGPDLGGVVDATSEVIQNSLIVTLKLAGKTETHLLITRTINPQNRNEMVMTAKHVPSGAETSSIYRRIN